MKTEATLQDSLNRTIAMVGALAHMESELKVMRRSLKQSRCKNRMSASLRSLGDLSTCLADQQGFLEAEIRGAAKP